MFGLIVYVGAVLALRLAIWAWFRWQARRDERLLAEIRRNVVDGLMDHLRPGWRDEINQKEN